MQESMQVEHYFLARSDVLNWNFTEEKFGVLGLRTNDCKQYDGIERQCIAGQDHRQTRSWLFSSKNKERR
jgi:hypothetical protein